jgi:hypothetical protein
VQAADFLIKKGRALQQLKKELVKIHADSPDGSRGFISIDEERGRSS